MMKYRSALLLAVGVAAIFYGLVCLNQIYWSRQTRQQTTVSDTAHQEATAHVDQAQALEPQETQQAREVQDAKAEVVRLRGEVARLRKGSAPQAPSLPDTPDTVAPLVDLAPLVARQDELIQAQDRQIAGLEASLQTVTASRDHYKAAFEDESRARTAQTLALEASLANAKAQRWKGRVEGFVVGLGSGYLGGKL